MAMAPSNAEKTQMEAQRTILEPHMLCPNLNPCALEVQDGA
jgi:hypothetical protein